MTLAWLADAHRSSPWEQARVVVTGIGRSGVAAADALLERGAHVTVLDADVSATDRATLLETLGADVRLGERESQTWPDGDVDLVVTSPGWHPTAPVLTYAARVGVPVWGDVELAWRWQDPERPTTWLGVTGTNGKTTTVQMVDAIARAAGWSSAAVGNIGRPILEAIQDDVSYDVFAVELSSFQLHWTRSLALHSAAVLNVQPDHLEWHHDADEYAADKGRIYARAQHSIVYNAADATTLRLAEEADVTEGARAIGITLGIPGFSMLGVVDGILADRAFVANRRDAAQELCEVADLPSDAPHVVANALAAAALTRSAGADAGAVRRGLAGMMIGGHRGEQVAERGGVAYLDDSKATNPHAADAALRRFDSVVLIAGGQAKGTTFDDLVRSHAGRLSGVVVVGVDGPVVAQAVRQHAPDVPLVEVTSGHTNAMEYAVQAAAAMARPGDAVLLAPGCASLDMFSGYADRGDAFARAVNELE